MFRTYVIGITFLGASVVLSGGAHAEQMEARALLKSRANAELSAEVEGLITQLPFRPGQAFKKGQALVRFDCRYYKAQMAKTAAALNAATATLQSRKVLFERKAASKLQLTLAEAEVARSEAEHSSTQLIVQRCSIKAPYTGRVVEWLVDKHEYVTTGTPILSILDDRNWEVRILAQSSWLSQLKKGATFKLMLDETGQTYAGSIERIGARIEPQSQTIEVFGKLSKPGRNLISGMSGVVVFDAPTQ